MEIYFIKGDHIWIEPVSSREFDVPIGARVITAEGRSIQVIIFSNTLSNALYKSNFSKLGH